MKFADIFKDGAVFQREMEIPVWGIATPNVLIDVKWQGTSYRTATNMDGAFFLHLPPAPAGGPFVLEATASDSGECCRISDVYVGEVYLASGQSNMEWTLSMSENTMSEVLPDGELPLVRMFTVEKSTALAGRDGVKGGWISARKNDVMAFSAVAFYFARKLQKELGCMVGIINSSWGGTIAEAWCSRAALASDPVYRKRLHNYQASLRQVKTWKNITAIDVNEYTATRGNVDEAILPPDAGNSGIAKGWASSDFDDSNWSVIELPASWRRRGFDYNGVLWFRKTVEIAPEWVGHELHLHFGGIDKTDISYVNGVEVGSSGGEFDISVWNKHREYVVPAQLITSTRVTVAVRARSFMFDGSFNGASESMRLDCGDQTVAALDGEWRCETEQNYGMVIPPPEGGPGNQNAPHVLFDAMIRPLIPYAMRGVIWYQGESNESEAGRYEQLMSLLIRDWRYHWGQEKLFFGVVQLSSYMEEYDYQSNSKWAIIREAQENLLKLGDVGLAVTIDVGESDNIHPRAKRPVGERLALWALNRTFGKNVVYSGPLFREKRVEGNNIRVLFDHACGGLSTRDGEAVRGFRVAGRDGVFHPATAQIDGQSVLIHSDKVSTPELVCYAWADCPLCVNLTNDSGLPASPFKR